MVCEPKYDDESENPLLEFCRCISVHFESTLYSCNVQKVLDEMYYVSFVPDKNGLTVLHRLSKMIIDNPHKPYLDIYRVLKKHSQFEECMSILTPALDSPLTILIAGLGDRYRNQKQLDEYLALFLAYPGSLEASPYTLPRAIECASSQFCEKLLSAQSSMVNQSFSEGESALHCAIRLDSLDKCKSILARNPDLTVKWHGMNALQYGLSIGCHADILELVGGHFDFKYIKRNLAIHRFRGESTLDTAKRLQVQSWINRLEDKQTFNQSQHSERRETRHRDNTGRNVQINTKKDIYKQLYSSEIPPRSQGYTMDDEKLCEIINTAHECNTQNEVRQIRKHILALAKHISHSIRNDNKFHFFSI